MDIKRMRARPISTLLFCMYCFFLMNGFVFGLSVHPATVEPDDEQLLNEQRIIYRIEPEQRGGEAFKLIYLVPAPIDVYWRFKTDFDGDFLLSNKYIKEHRHIRDIGNVTITENKYSNVPNETFRWRTTVHPDQYRLTFQLENPEDCGQEFNYGVIQLEPFKSYTKVTHLAYFDFFGASLWVNLPLEGGMSTFLKYTARWEQETISRLKQQYTDQPAK